MTQYTWECCVAAYKNPFGRSRLSCVVTGSAERCSALPASSQNIFYYSVCGIMPSLMTIVKISLGIC